MFDQLVAWLRVRIADAMAHATSTLRAALRPAGVVGGVIADMTRSRAELIAENALLRQQLIVASRATKRAVARPHERGLLVLLASLVPRWREAMLIVKPETILRWHRAGFRLFCRWRSRSPQRPEARVGDDVVELIVRMARENRLWDAERIRGELLKLGIRVAKRTVQRHMRAARPAGGPRLGPSWKTFLRTHVVWACDFLQIYDVWFRPIFAFFIIDVNTKRVVHVAVTRAPSEPWTAQQLREAMPFGCGARFIIRDRDGKFGGVFDRVAKGAGMRVLRTAVRAPLMNTFCERFLGSVRRECLDHVIVLNERHARTALVEFAQYYFNRARPHQGIAQRVPMAPACVAYGHGACVIARAVLGGLHHDYTVAA